MDRDVGVRRRHQEAGDPVRAGMGCATMIGGIDLLSLQS